MLYIYCAQYTEKNRTYLFIIEHLRKPHELRQWIPNKIHKVKNSHYIEFTKICVKKASFFVTADPS